MSYINLLTRIKNSQMAQKDGLRAPFSKNDMVVAEILARNGYLKSAEKKGRMPHRIIDIKLKYDDDWGALSDFKLLSVPSRHLYIGYKDLKSVRSGYGLAVISTSKGIMTAGQAKKQKLGGELLFEIW